MFPSATCRLSVPLAASIFRASIALAETTTVGGHRIVVGVADRACRWTDAGLLAAIAEGD
jgi:hypothetical protein